MRIKAVVAYDGTEYSGFQRQKNVPTIQEELESVLETLTQVQTRIVAAGRTDTGVHAEGQVIAFDTEWRHSIIDLHRGMNALLPKSIAISSLQSVKDSFHPRYDAYRRYYRYTIYRDSVRDPLVRFTSLHIPDLLAVEAMQVAAQMLVGRHDFAAFGSPPQGTNTVREIYKATWSEEGHWLFFDVVANAFLYRMVRIMVGTLLRVGVGKLSTQAFQDILHTQDRRKAGPAIAAHGLCLKAVYYES